MVSFLQVPPPKHLRFFPIYTAFSAHRIVLYLIIWIKLFEYYKSWRFSLYSLIQSLITSSLLGPNFFCALFLCNLHEIDEVSQASKTTDKIKILFICNFLFLRDVIKSVISLFADIFTLSQISELRVVMHTHILNFLSMMAKCVIRFFYSCRVWRAWKNRFCF